MAEEQAVVSVPDLLLRHGLVTRETLNEANRRKREQDKPLGRVLFEMQAINESKKLALFKQHFGMEVVSLSDFKISPQDITALPRSFCERNCLVPIMRERGTLVLAVEDPTNIRTLDEAASLSSMPIHAVIASCKDILTALKQYPDKPLDEEPDLETLLRLRRKRIIHDILFVIVALLPLPIFFVLLAQMQGLQRFFISELETYEKTLVFFLTWALWAAIVYEFDGLILKRMRISD